MFFGLLGMRSPGDTRLLIDGVARSGAIAECLNGPAPKRPAARRALSHKKLFACGDGGARPLWASLCVHVSILLAAGQSDRDAGHFSCSPHSEIRLWKVVEIKALCESICAFEVALSQIKTYEDSSKSSYL